MNWNKVIEALNSEAACIARRLEQCIADKKDSNNKILVITGEQRVIDLQTMQLLTIAAKALKSGVNYSRDIDNPISYSINPIEPFG